MRYDVKNCAAERCYNTTNATCFKGFAVSHDLSPPTPTHLIEDRTLPSELFMEDNGNLKFYIMLKRHMTGRAAATLTAATIHGAVNYCIMTKDGEWVEVTESRRKDAESPKHLTQSMIACFVVQILNLNAFLSFHYHGKKKMVNNSTD